MTACCPSMKGKIQMWLPAKKVKYVKVASYKPPQALEEMYYMLTDPDYDPEGEEPLIDACHIDGKRVTLFDGPSYVLDYKAGVLSADDGIVTIPAQKTSYFHVLISHPGINPILRSYVDDVLDQMEDLDQIHTSLASLLEYINVNTDAANPLRRPAPLGLSLMILANDPFGEIHALLTQRSRRVALNPEVWTTSVDEGIRAIGAGDISQTLHDGLADELGIKSKDDVFAGAQETVGFFLPDPAPVSVLGNSAARSGANEVAEVYVNDLSILLEIEQELVKGDREAGVEFAGAKVVPLSHFPEFFGNGETPSEVLAAWYLATAEGRN